MTWILAKQKCSDLRCHSAMRGSLDLCFPDDSCEVGETISFLCASLMINWCPPPWQKMCPRGSMGGPCPLRFAPSFWLMSSCTDPEKWHSRTVSQLSEFQKGMALAGLSQRVRKGCGPSAVPKDILQSGGQGSVGKER